MAVIPLNSQGKLKMNGKPCQILVDTEATLSTPTWGLRMRSWENWQRLGKGEGPYRVSSPGSLSAVPSQEGEK